MLKKILISAVLMMTLTACGNAQGKESNNVSTPTPGGTNTVDNNQVKPSAEPTAAPTVAPEAGDEVSPQLSDLKDGEELAVLYTNMGNIKLRFFPEYAPVTVQNFVTHAKDGYYNGITFHRVYQNFMIQGGDPTATGTGGESIWGKPFKDEFSTKLHHIRGAISMANPGIPDSNGSQFFIVQRNDLDEYSTQQLTDIKANLDKVIFTDEKSGKTITNRFLYPEDIVNEYFKNGGTYHLDYQHSVFGQVVEGMDVVDAIANVEAVKEKPVKDVIIEKIEFETYKAS